MIPSSKFPGKIAREILGSKSFLNDWEKTFLTNIPKNIRKFGSLTNKQEAKLDSIALRSGIDTQFNPKKNKLIATILQFEDLCRIASAKLTNSEKIFVRLQLREHKKYDTVAVLDKLKIHQIHKKYFT